MASVLDKTYELLADAWSSVRGVAVGFVDGDGKWSPASDAAPLPTKLIAAAGGGITWSAPVAVAMSGSSKTFVPANAARKALQMWSAPGNAAGAIDIAGGTVTLAGSVPIFAGAAPIYCEGAATPVGVVTAIGTNLQNFYYQEGV